MSNKEGEEERKEEEMKKKKDVRDRWIIKSTQKNLLLQSVAVTSQSHTFQRLEDISNKK